MPSLGPLSGTPLSTLEDGEIPVSADDLDDFLLIDFGTEAIFLNVLEDGISAVLSLGATELLNVLSDSALALSDAVGFQSLNVSISDSAASTTSVLNELIPNLRDWVLATSSVNARASFYSNLSAGGGFTDAIACGWNLILTTEAEGADTAEGIARRLAAVADTLQATGLADGKLTARAAVAVAAALEARIYAGYSVTAADQAALTAEVASILAAMPTLADTAALADSAVGAMRLSLICAENVTLADALAANLSASADIDDALLVYCSFSIGGNEYSGWAMNTDLRAVTQHANQNFDSILPFKKYHYAAGPGGIVQITGANDSGEDINAYVRTFLSNFGTHKFKRAPDVWLGLVTDGRMLVKTRTRDPSTGAALEDWYEVITKQDAGEASGRAKVGRGLKSTWWGLTLQNIDGADFRLDEIAWRVLTLDRRQ